MTGKELVDAIINDGGFDVARTKVLAVAQQRLEEMVANAQWRLAERDLGPTVVGTFGYDLPADVSDVDSVVLRDASGDTWYERTGERTLLMLRAGRVSWGGQPAFAPFYKADGTPQVQLYPTPDTSGVSIVALTAGRPPAIQDDDTPEGSPAIPVDLHPYLRDGSVGVLYKLIEEAPDVAAAFEQQFVAGTELLRRRRNSRLGSGPVQMRVSGYQL